MKRNFIKQSLFLLLSCLLILPHAFASFPPITPIAPIYSIQTDSNRYIVHFVLPEYEMTNYYDSICGNYTAIDMNADCDYTDFSGYPQLPFFSINLLLPANITSLQLNSYGLITDTITPRYVIEPAPFDSLALGEKEVWSIG